MKVSRTRSKMDQQRPHPPTAFKAAFGSERQCRRFLFRKKWPNGFECPKCNYGTALERQGGRKWVCGRKGCTYRESPAAGTIVESIKKPLRLWFWGLWLYTHALDGMTASRLQEELGLGSYQTAWTWCHKFRAAIQNHPGWLSALEPLDAPFLGDEERDDCLGIHGWRDKQHGGLTRFRDSLCHSPQITAFRSWLIRLNVGRSSAKHDRAYWAEHQLWMRHPSPRRRWAMIGCLLPGPSVPYWQLVRRVSPQLPLRAEAVEAMPPPGKKNGGPS